jgi:cysteinyl-tRNA synthetase
MHSQRLSRQFERTVAQLRALEETRRTQEKHDLNSLIDIMEMVESTGETYDPSADGFVFSDQQIADRISARRREHLALEAYEHRCESEAA